MRDRTLEYPLKLLLFLYFVKHNNSFTVLLRCEDINSLFNYLKSYLLTLPPSIARTFPALSTASAETD